MRVESLHLERFRGFESFDLGLHEQVTVLAGLNGSGKTAVLDAIAVALGAWMSGTTQCRGEDRPLRPADARLVRQETHGLPTANPRYPVVVEATGVYGGEGVRWARELTHQGGRTTTARAKTIRDTARRAEATATRDAEVALPLFAYYGTGRLWVQNYDTRPKKLGSRMQGYSACLEPASNTKLFQRWMAWREDNRLQQIAAAAERGAGSEGVSTPHLDAVTRAAQACLEGVSRLYYSANHRELRVEFADGRLLPFERLSDGQRSLVVLAADLAWRASQLNPHFGASAPEHTAGVVLIDEVELHLHPAWQRGVLASLTKTFPRLQFVVTTHSPQVLSTARPAWVRLLRDVGGGEVVVEQTGPLYGRDTNAILREVMGVSDRPLAMEARLAEVERLVEENDAVGARARLEDLRQDLGAGDASLMALEWELHHLELELAGEND